MGPIRHQTPSLSPLFSPTMPQKGQSRIPSSLSRFSSQFPVFFLVKIESLMQRRVICGGIASGSMSTVSREEKDVVMSSEDSSAYPDESELELGLGLSLGGGGGKGKGKPGGSWDQYARILTAKDFPLGVKGSASSSSSSSSSPVNKGTSNGSCGTKRTAEPSFPPGRSAVSSQVVGWPPIRTYRMSSLVKHAKSEESASTFDKCKATNTVVDKTNSSSNMNNNAAQERALLKTSLFVKVNMDGVAIGRKVDLNAHSCYETLAHVLDDMFRLSAAVGARRSKIGEHVLISGTRQPLRLLDGSSDFLLTYEDKEGDWMLVGDVPWEMFLSSVRRLRIRRAAEANGIRPLAPISQERNRGQLMMPI